MTANDTSANVIAFGGNTMVYESVKRFALKGLNDLIRVLMESVDDSLFELSEKVENDQDRSMYFEAMRELRLKRQSIQESFASEMQSSFDRLILNKAPASSSDSDELSLVEQDEIEDRIAIENMISKARPHFEDDLFAVSERLKTILHRKQVREDLNPLDPKAICDSFHNASQILDTDIQVKLIFYKLFDKYVMANLGRFYQEMNDLFIQKGVLPEFKAEQERLKQTTRYMANRLTRKESEKDNPNILDELMQVDQNETRDRTPVAGQGNVLSMLQHLLSATGQAPVPAGTVAVATPQVSASGQPGSASPLGDGSAPVAYNPIYVSALTGMQSAPHFNQPVASVDPQALQSEIHQQMVTFRQQNEQHGNTADNQIIDIVSMLFDFFFDDEALPDPIKVLIGRLQIPILKVAIMDGSFFNHKKHPARKLLDSISKVALGWSDDEQKEIVLVEKIESIVEFLLSEFDEDVAVFEQALDDFNAFLDQEKKKVEDNLQKIKQQENEREQNIEQAQQATDSLLQKLESKFDFSFEVVDFLQGVWKSVLFNTYLTQGEHSNHWKNLKKISSTLIWTLIPKHSEDEKKKLLQTLPPLLRALSKGMELVQVDKVQQNLVFQMLVLEHAKNVKQTSKNIVTRVDDQTVWPEQNMEDAFAGYNELHADDKEVDLLLQEDETGEMKIVDNSDVVEAKTDPVVQINRTETQDVIRNLQEFTDGIVKGDVFIDEEIVMESAEQITFQQQSEDDSDDCLQQAQELEIGTWIEFMESDNRWQNAKLSWKSKVTGKYVFVNRQGHKVRNMTLYGLATEFRAGRAKLIESVSVFDRAINSFMSGLRH